MISDEAKAKYLKDGGNHCPYCGSDEIDSGNIRYGDELWMLVRCERCEKLWKDLYKLSGVEEYHADEEE